MSKKLISIIVPIFNEENNILLLCYELSKAFKSLKNKYNYEIIFVNDGSVDKSQEILDSLADENKNIRYLQFSRNFGKEIAVSAGIHKAKGDAAIIIDADLQHPPELIPEFIDKWQRGTNIVIGVRKNNKHETICKRICSFLFYKTINGVSKTHIIPNATDYRLLDKKVIKEFNRFTERDRITRGLLDWLGFKRELIYFDPNGRRSGKTKYSYVKLTKLALSAMVSHSLFPLKFAGYLGIAITFLAGTFGFLIWIDKYIIKGFLHLNFTGTAMLAVLVIFLVGIVLVCLGLIALYIAEIQGEVMNRPMYVIKKMKNIHE